MNWDTYQRDDREGDRPNDRKVTNDRQTTDRQPTKNNKNKNVKNEKNERRRAPHQKEFRQFMQDYGMNIGWDDAWVEWQANMEEEANPDDIIGSIAHYDAYLAEHEYKRRNPANYLANGWWQSFTKPMVVKDPKAAKEADEWAALDKQMKAEVKG